MDPLLVDIESDMREITSRIGLSLAIPSFIETVQKIAARRSELAWTGSKGLYLFESEGRVKYLGRALGTFLGERLRSQCRARGHEPWDAVLDDPATRVRLYLLEPAEWYWAASVEAYLIERHRPPINKRVS